MPCRVVRPGRNAFFTGMYPLRTGMIPPQLPGSPSYLKPGTPALAECCSAVRGFDDAKPFFAQHLRDGEPKLVFVFDHQHSYLGAGNRPGVSGEDGESPKVVSAGGHRAKESEGSALAGSADEADRPAVGGDHTLHNGQTQTTAGEFSREERVEHPGSFLFRHPAADVRDL